MRLRWLGAGLVALAAGSAAGFSGGVSGYSGSGPAVCTQCHNGMGTPPVVKISGAPVLTAGETSTYTITITSASPMRKHGGVDVSTSAGTLAPAGGNPTRVDNGEIVHAKMAGPFDKIDFRFDLTAPMTPGTATLSGYGLSCDGTGGTGGDNGAVDKLMVTIVGAPDLAMDPPDFAGVDLTGADLAEPPPPDLARPPVDATSGATPMPDMATPPKKDEPRWACGCRLGATAPSGAAAAGLAALLLAIALWRARRR